MYRTVTIQLQQKGNTLVTLTHCALNEGNIVTLPYLVYLFLLSILCVLPNPHFVYCLSLGKKLEMLALEKKFMKGEYMPFQDPIPGVCLCN